MNKDETIRLTDILYVMWKRRLWLITLLVCGLVVGIVLSVFNYMRGEMQRTYAITSAIAVTSQTQDGLYTSKERTPNSTDITLAQNMAESVLYVLKSDKCINAAIRQISLVGISVSDVYNNLTVTKVGNTQIIEMKLYWRNAEEGVEILNAINAVAPDILAEVLQIGNVSVVNMPKSQYRIGGSVNASLWVLIALGGFLLGCGLCVLETLLLPKLIVPQDMCDVMGMDVLAEIPENKKMFVSGESVLVTQHQDHAWNENIISAARLLKHKMRDMDNHILCITSTTVGEGKSNIAARLACQLAEQERRVLLVDLDIQDPTLTVLFQERCDYYHSLNALYRGDCSRTEAVMHLAPGLDLLPCNRSKNADLPLDHDLLSLLRSIAEQYDDVLIDLPPVGLSSDLFAMEELTTNVLFVARCDTAQMRTIQTAVGKIQKTDMQIIGCVVNGTSGRVSKTAQEFYKGRQLAIRKAASMPVTTVQQAYEEVPQTADEQERGKQELMDDSLARSYEEFRSTQTVEG